MGPRRWRTELALVSSGAGLITMASTMDGWVVLCIPGAVALSHGGFMAVVDGIDAAIAKRRVAREVEQEQRDEQ